MKLILVNASTDEPLGDSVELIDGKLTFEDVLIKGIMEVKRRKMSDEEAFDYYTNASNGYWHLKLVKEGATDGG